MTLVESDGSFRSLPARAREIFDVSGAGDTVIATLALAHASGMPLTEAMRIANAAAGVVVSKFGTATATVAEVMHEIEDQEAGEGDDVASLVSLIRATELVSRWKKRGLKVGFANGCFDILHPGHVSLLKAARGECNRLVVALNTDASVRQLKGPTRPINDLNTRAQMIAALRYVDCVVAFDAETPIDLIRQLLPDVLIKGSDYTVDKVVGADVVQAAGGRVFLADLVPGKSTTEIINRVGVRALQPAEPS
jgi:D-beta-D-heptose 7-phosphate kinase/D-beta-D-heptose 1-phosphate adenosyltransferase